MIYCVEDEDSIRNLMTYALEASGFTAKGFPDSVEFFKAVAEEKPDLVLLDIMLPGKDGLEILRSLRSDPATAKIPVIMASARGPEFEKVSRIRAVLRRTTPAAAAATLGFDGLCMDPNAHTLTLDGASVVLTLKEFALLRLFLENPGQVFTREQLLEQVWETSYVGETRTVDVHMGTLRTKLGRWGSHVRTVRGVGYRLEVQP